MPCTRAGRVTFRQALSATRWCMWWTRLSPGKHRWRVHSRGPPHPWDRPYFVPAQPGSKSRRRVSRLHIKRSWRALKWRQWKLHLMWERERTTDRSSWNPRTCSSVARPQGKPQRTRQQSWVLEPMQKMQQAFQQSLREHPPIAPEHPIHSLFFQLTAPFMDHGDTEASGGTYPPFRLRTLNL